MRLNRTTSASIRRKAGRRAFRRWANRVVSEVPRHSTPLASSDTLKLMSLALVATPSRSNRRTRPG